jgi:hypothetical protein
VRPPACSPSAALALPRPVGPLLTLPQHCPAVLTLPTAAPPTGSAATRLHRRPHSTSRSYSEALCLTAPMAAGLLPVPAGLAARLRGVVLQVLMDGVQRAAFDQVRLRLRPRAAWAAVTGCER